MEGNNADEKLAVCLSKDENMNLIPGKIYKVRKETDFSVKLIDETGAETEYPSLHFLIIYLPVEIEDIIRNIKN